MRTIKWALGFALLCLVTLVGSSPCLASTTDLLYVQEGKNVITYSVNNTTAVTKKLGTLTTKFESVV